MIIAHACMHISYISNLFRGRTYSSTSVHIHIFEHNDLDISTVGNRPKN